MDENKNNMWLWLMVAAVVVVGGYLVYQQVYTSPAVPQVAPPVETTNPSKVPEEKMMDKKEGTDTMMKKEGASRETVVTVTRAGFSPATVTVKAGDTVKWVNNDSIDHDVSSAVHPTHKVYPPLNLGVVKPGASLTLEFTEVGSYKYHDHLSPKLFGTVVVQ